MHQTTIKKPFIMHMIAKHARLLIKVSGVRISGGSPDKKLLKQAIRELLFQALAQITPSFTGGIKKLIAVKRPPM
jgi:hypothetical protein